MTDETPNQRKWRLIREHQEQRANEAPKPRRRRVVKRDNNPAYGSQQWAETYSDNLGESADY
jgi:hypothetical protein